MQPSLEQLIQIARTLAHDYDFVRVVLASIPSNLQDDTPVDVQLIEGCSIVVRLQLRPT